MLLLHPYYYVIFIKYIMRLKILHFYLYPLPRILFILLPLQNKQHKLQSDREHVEVVFSSCYLQTVKFLCLGG